MTRLKDLNILIEQAVKERHKPNIVEVTSLKGLFEMASMGGGAGPHVPAGKKENESVRKEMKTEMMLRQYIRNKIKKSLLEEKKAELALRKVIRELIMEGDVSDVHPHRSTGINVLEDVLKKSIPTLRADYKRLTTDKSQRESFRAHVIKAVEDQLKPSLVNDKYPLEEPTPDPTQDNVGEKPSDRVSQDVDNAFTGADTLGGESPEASDEIGTDEPADEMGDQDAADLANDLAALEEQEIGIDIGGDTPDEEKFAGIEDDDGLSDEEAFGQGLEGMDETGRNMAYTSFRKISQYILDAYDTLANMEDKNVFVDYLVTNLKLYFDKFEAELQKQVQEPTTDQYQQQAAI